jgi:hypothetical protein
MDKNQAFSSPGDVAREKQKRRRTEKRKEEFNDTTEKTFREEFRGTRVFVQNIPEHVRWQDVSFFLWLRLRRLTVPIKFECLFRFRFAIFTS